MEADAKADQAELEENILQDLTKFGPMSANQLWERMGGNRARVLDVLRQMDAGSRLVKRPNPRGNGYILHII